MTALRTGGLMLDTNVWLDYCIPTRPGHERAFALIDACLANGITLYAAISSYKDIFYLVEKAFRRALAKDARVTGSLRAVSEEMAWGLLDTIAEMSEVVGADVSDVWMAGKLRSMHGDFEDNLVVAACQRANVAHLVSEDAELKAHAPLSVLTVDQALSLLAIEM